MAAFVFADLTRLSSCETVTPPGVRILAAREGLYNAIIAAIGGRRASWGATQAAAPVAAPIPMIVQRFSLTTAPAFSRMPSSIILRPSAIFCVFGSTGPGTIGIGEAGAGASNTPTLDSIFCLFAASAAAAASRSLASNLSDAVILPMTPPRFLRPPATHEIAAAMAT